MSVAFAPPPSPEAPADAGQLSLVDLYISRQSQLTAVERFSQWHADDRLPRQAQQYQRLLPAAPPGVGEQYAFEVDLDRCSGCKACVTACHTLNGLDDDETWREVGLLHGGRPDSPVLQHVTSACHHCLDPACLSGCPVRAYEKHPVTGIVKHLDDQCFGCQYCIFACPYSVPKYNPARGIVRKCDLCSSRLEAGEAPACAQACPHEAIRITVVKADEVVADCAAGMFLPGTPDPQITFPTTTYKTERVLPRSLLPADHDRVHAEEAHPPLIAMLVLTQLSVGAFVVDWLQRWLSAAPWAELQAWQAAFALICGWVALAASTLHLGRPHLAWRAVLGLRTSWLSREIVAFGVFAALATVQALLSVAGGAVPPAWKQVLEATVILSGLAGVGCSVMVYQYVRRPTWTAGNVGFRFLMTTLLLGASAVLGMAVLWARTTGTLPVAEVFTAWGDRLAVVVAALAGLKLLGEATAFVPLSARVPTPRKRAAQLLAGELALVTWRRFGIGLAAGVALPILLVTRGGILPADDNWLLAAAAVSFVGLVVAELHERYLFFAAAVAPRMPGGLTT